jgi:hypothetical protein
MTKNMHDWDVHVKGNQTPYRIKGAADVTVHPDADTIRVVDEDGNALAMFPHNAVAAVIRVKE